LISGILNLVISVIVFLLIQALISYAYPSTIKELFSNNPELLDFLINPPIVKFARQIFT
jgi:hypothetical protein